MHARRLTSLFLLPTLWLVSHIDTNSFRLLNQRWVHHAFVARIAASRTLWMSSTAVELRLRLTTNSVLLSPPLEPLVYALFSVHSQRHECKFANCWIRTAYIHTKSGMTGIRRGITKEGSTYHTYIYFIRAVHSRLCGARSGSPNYYNKICFPSLG